MIPRKRVRSCRTHFRLTCKHSWGGKWRRVNTRPKTSCYGMHSAPWPRKSKTSTPCANLWPNGVPVIRVLPSKTRSTPSAKGTGSAKRDDLPLTPFTPAKPRHARFPPSIRVRAAPLRHCGPPANRAGIQPSSTLRCWAKSMSKTVFDTTMPTMKITPKRDWTLMAVSVR